MVLGEMTKEDRVRLAEFRSLFRRLWGAAHDGDYSRGTWGDFAVMQDELLNSLLARALKAEFGLRCFQFNNAPNDHADHYDEIEKHIWTDADWLSEAERILRG